MTEHNKKPAAQDQRKDSQVNREPANKGMSTGGSSHSKDSSSKKEADRTQDKDKGKTSSKRVDEDDDDTVAAQRQGRRDI